MTTTYKRKLQLLGLALIGLAIVYGRVALSYGAAMGGGTVEAGAVPLILAATLGVLSVLLIVTAHRQEPTDATKTRERRREVATAARFFGALVGYVLLVSFVGFLPATLVSVAAILRFFFSYSLRRTALYAGALTLVCYLIFDLALGVRLP